MAQAVNDRVKASKIRALKKAGKVLNAKQQAFLDAYDKNSHRDTIRKAKATAPGAPIIRGPQLQIAGTSHASGRHIQKTAPPSGNVDPQAHLWTPTVPPASSGAEPPPPGAPPAPTEGSPILGNAPPTVDPKAGEQLAFMVCAVCGVGVASAMQLLATVELPAALIPYLQQGITPANIDTAMKQLAEACKRLAVKYQLKGVPMSDELMVGAALTGSVAAVVYAHKKKKKEPKKVAPATPHEAAAAAPSSPGEPPQAPSSDLDVLWGKS